MVVTPSGQGRNTQTRTALKMEWVHGTRRKLSAIWQRITDKTPGLPHFSPPISMATCAPPNMLQPQTPKLLLMSCMKRSRYFRELFQDDINGVYTDQALFCFLQRQIKKRQWRMRRVFSFESVRGIHFVKVSHILSRWAILNHRQVRLTGFWVRKCAHSKHLSNSRPMYDL